MGFGHRVYKSGDLRVPTMRKYFAKVAKAKKDKKFEKIYDIVEKVMIERKIFIQMLTTLQDQHIT